MLYGPEGCSVRPTLDDCVETTTRRSRRTHQRPGADKREYFTPAHFMAFRAFIALRRPFFIAGAASAAAFFIAFAMTEGETSECTETQ